MKFIVTGATGFVGQHVVDAMLASGHSVVAVARKRPSTESLGWLSKVDFHELDIAQSCSALNSHFADCDGLVHLAWPGLPNYDQSFHFETNLPDAFAFLKTAVLAGCPRIVVTGTCLEYGAVTGCLSEQSIPQPACAYAVGKDALRRFLCEFQKEVQFNLLWCRLFYMYGNGQGSNSLFSQLDAAISRGDKTFNMSGGEQLRDYLPVAEVAGTLVQILERNVAGGIVNICSGIPRSVRSLVERRIAVKGAKIDLNLGYYAYPDHEPFAFWGDRSKLNQILQTNG